MLASKQKRHITEVKPVDNEYRKGDVQIGDTRVIRGVKFTCIKEEEEAPFIARDLRNYAVWEFRRGNEFVQVEVCPVPVKELSHTSFDEFRYFFESSDSADESLNGTHELLVMMSLVELWFRRRNIVDVVGYKDSDNLLDLRWRGNSQ